MRQNNIVTTEFIEKFRELEDMVADVHIKHILYGNQKIKRCILHPIADGERIGLYINGEDVYITTDELLRVKFDNGECIVEGEVMQIHIIM